MSGCDDRHSSCLRSVRACARATCLAIVSPAGLLLLASLSLAKCIPVRSLHFFVTRLSGLCALLSMVYCVQKASGVDMSDKDGDGIPDMT